jgi:hypothetical protein
MFNPSGLFAPFPLKTWCLSMYIYKIHVRYVGWSTQSIFHLATRRCCWTISFFLLQSVFSFLSLQKSQGKSMSNVWKLQSISLLTGLGSFKKSCSLMVVRLFSIDFFRKGVRSLTAHIRYFLYNTLICEPYMYIYVCVWEPYTSKCHYWQYIFRLIRFKNWKTKRKSEKNKSFIWKLNHHNFRGDMFRRRKQNKIIHTHT